MINYNEILADINIVSMYEKIDLVNNFPFNHGMKHVLNVINLMKKLTKVLNIKDDEVNKILIACVLHDVGQVDGRENHALKSRNFAEKYLIGKIKKEDLKEILNAIEFHSSKNNFENISKFSSLLIFIDKMDFSNARLEKNYKDRFGYVVYEDVEDINFKLENTQFSLLIETNKKITSKNLLAEKQFFYKVINALKIFAHRLGLEYQIIIDNEILDIEGM